MTHTVEQLSAIRRSITVEAPAEAVEKAFKEAVAKVNAEAKVPGFRPGKIPEQVILQKFGKDVELEAVRALVRDTFPPAVTEAGLNPLSEPEIETIAPIVHGQPYTYKAVVEVYPEVKVQGLSELTLERHEIEVLDAEVENELLGVQRQMTQLEPSPEGELGPGLIGMIDFKGTAGGEPFPGSEAENYVVDFGTGALLQEFEAQIQGMKHQEERDIAFDYPADFFKKEIAGKRGEFKVKLKDLRRKIVPELSDAFAKELGDFANLDAVREDIRKRIHEYKERMAVASLREQAIRGLIEKNQGLEVPTTLINSELSNMIDQLRQQVEARGQKFDVSKMDARRFVQENIKEATDRARGFMLVRQVMLDEKVELTEEELQERINRMASESRATPQQVREYLEQNKQMDSVRSQAIFEKSLDVVVGKAKVVKAKAEKAHDGKAKHEKNK